MILLSRYRAQELHPDSLVIPARGRLIDGVNRSQFKRTLSSHPHGPLPEVGHAARDGAVLFEILRLGEICHGHLMM